MASNEWYVNVTRLTNGFAVIQRFQDGQQARVLLDVTRNSIHVACAYMPRRFAPRFKGCPRCRNSSINISASSGSNLCQRLTGRRIDAIDILTIGRLDPLVINEQVER